MALLLVLAVPILCAVARRGWYLSPSDHSHYLIDASKAKVAHGPLLQVPSPVRTLFFSVASRPQMHAERHLELTSFFSLYSLSVTISLQHRSPPILLI